MTETENTDLEWDATSQEGKDVPEQELPEYTPAAFEVPTTGNEIL